MGFLWSAAKPFKHFNHNLQNKKSATNAKSMKNLEMSRRRTACTTCWPANPQQMKVVEFELKHAPDTTNQTTRVHHALPQTTTRQCMQWTSSIQVAHPVPPIYSTLPYPNKYTCHSNHALLWCPSYHIPQPL